MASMNNNFGPLSRPFSVSHQAATHLHPTKVGFAQRDSCLSSRSGNVPRPRRQSSQSSPRVVMSGRCTFTARDPRQPFMFSECICPAGRYDTPTSDDTLCKECTHKLADHENAQLSGKHDSIAEGKLSLGGQCFRLVDDPTRCPREQTVSALWKRIQAFHIIHVRATPASGKSTLSRLLQEYVQRENPELPVLWCSWPVNLPESLGRGFEKLLDYAFDVPQNEQLDWMRLQALLIIDEAQGSYDCGSLWNDYIKYITPSHAPMVILFSSWGSATSRSEALSGTPIYLSDGQRISIRPSEESTPSVFFTHAEFLDVVERVKKYEAQYGQKFLPDLDVVEYVWKITNGHPAAVRATLKILATSENIRQYRKTSSVIPLDIALRTLGEDANFVSKLAVEPSFRRGLPPRQFLQRKPGVVEALRNVLLSNCVEGVWESDEHGNLHQVDEYVNICYRQGWLQAELAPMEDTDGLEKTVYIFPSVLHQRCAEWLLARDTPPFPKEEYPSVETLCMEAIKRFSPIALTSAVGRLGSGAECRPLEAVYQDEIYRSCYSLLGNIYLSSEWSGKTKNGRVDFLVRDMNWAIECVRDGSRLDEHVDRFLKGGRYYPWIMLGQITDFILLDFRKSIPQKSQDGDIPWLYHIVFSPDYGGYQVYDSKLKKRDGPVSLVNH